MAESSGIAWTRSTFNGWIGCTKIGPGCDSCYAEVQDSRKRWGGITHWGAGVPRHRTSASYWHKPEVWNKIAPMSEFAGRKGFWPVFCSSLADVFDNEVDDLWRTDLFQLINRTPNLSWLLVTKRIGNVRGLIPSQWRMSAFPDNVRLMITVVNQEEADRDIPKLLALKCKNGISYEPALGPVNFSRWLPRHKMYDHLGINWVIIGGESKQGKYDARPFNVQWARDTIMQCKATGVPVFMKQCGSLPYCPPTTPDGAHEAGSEWSSLKDRAGADPSEWPEDLRVREFPE